MKTRTKILLLALTVAIANSAYAAYKTRCSFCNGSGFQGNYKCVYCKGAGES